MSLTLNNNQKMGKLLRLLTIPLAVAAIAVGCTKEKESANIKQDSNNSEAVNVKISVDYPQTSPETKTIIEQNPAGGLKVSWDANEEISLLSFDGDNNLISVDNLTSTGEKGRNTAIFTGKYSKPNGAKGWIIVYPSLAEDKEYKYNGTFYFMGDKVGGITKPGHRRRTAFKLNGSYCHTRNFTNIFQVENNDMSHLRQWDIMSAKIESEPSTGGIRVATMQKHCAIFHLNLSVDPAHIGKRINKVCLNSYRDRDITGGSGDNHFGWLDKENSDLISLLVYLPKYILPTLNLYLGKDDDYGGGYGGIEIPSDGKLSVYMPFFIHHSSSKPAIFKQGAPLGIELSYDNNGNSKNYDGLTTITGIVETMQKNLELLPGKIYTINATLPKDYIKVTSIVPEKEEVTVKVGESVIVKFISLPKNALHQKVNCCDKCEFFSTNMHWWRSTYDRTDSIRVFGLQVGEKDLTIENTNSHASATVKVKVVAK